MHLGYSSLFSLYKYSCPILEHRIALLRRYYKANIAFVLPPFPLPLFCTQYVSLYVFFFQRLIFLPNNKGVGEGEVAIIGCWSHVEGRKKMAAISSPLYYRGLWGAPAQIATTSAQSFRKYIIFPPPKILEQRLAYPSPNMLFSCKIPWPPGSQSGYTDRKPEAKLR
jgi:hypothetical protein